MIAPGTVLQNRYLVEEQIGQGGMGAVFVATDQRFGSRVALKETFFEDPNLRKAFEREAKLLNRLRHHALPRVSDHFTEEEGQFLVMEYIPGEDLSNLLKSRGPFPIAEVLDWADQLLDALDYLHTQEHPVIHRDIKPQNLKLTSRNQIVLLDFGLAKGTPLQTRVTNTGSVLGYSLNYAPLEQMQGTGTDPRSDIYSLGATLYHLMTGVTPPDALTRATAVLNGELDPLRPASEMHVQVPPGISAILSQAMSQSANRRFATAAEMRRALKEANRESAVQPGLNATVVTGLVTQSSEQETQILGRSDQNMTAGLGPKQTEVAPLPDSSTVTDPGRTSPIIPPEVTRARESDSVVTAVRPPIRDAGSGRSRRAYFGIAAGVTALVVAGIALYAFTYTGDQRQQREAPPVANANIATPSPETSVVSSPEVATTPSAKPTSSPTQSVARRASPGANPKTSEANTSGDQTIKTPPDVPAPPDPEAVTGQYPQAPANAGLSREELQAIMERVAEQRRRALQQRRMIERERRRRRALPPP